MAHKEKTPEDNRVAELLLGILKTIEQEDIYIRQQMLREAKQLELYWHGFQYIFWDEGAQDFRIPTHEVLAEMGSREEVKFMYDYVINTFKAHGLSIIAALSADIPNVPFSPQDADSPRDVIAAKKAELAGKIIVRKNDSKLLFYHALFILFTNHFVAAYNYYERDKKYGSIEIPKFKTSKTKGADTFNCLECDYSTEMDLADCPHCGEKLQKKEGEITEAPEEVGSETFNKGMSRIKIKGTLNVKLPVYAADQASIGYLIDYADEHYASLRALYPEIRDQIGTGGEQDTERMARTPSLGRYYADSSNSSLRTLKRVWLRPWMFDTLDEGDATLLKERFPTGVYFASIDNNLFAESREEDLDDHWTITKGDLSRSLTGDPLGKSLLPLQDLENNVSNLLVESLEHSVPSTFADPEMFDFDTFSQQEVAPGTIYPAKNSLNPQRRMEDYFFNLKTATLPKEGVDFNKIFETKSQFVVGDFPSIFGGPQKQGSKTLGEYQESRNYALQRLSIPYQLLTFWWATVIHKAVIDYKTNMIADEKYTVRSAEGKLDSVSLTMEDLSGRFEMLMAEGATDLPVSFTQKRMLIRDMVRLNSEYLNEFLFASENRRTTLRFLGMEELSDIDASQSFKQLREIDEMLRGIDIEVEPIVDDDEIHLRGVKAFLASDIGYEHKKANPQGYQRIVQHGEHHYNSIMQKMQTMQGIEQGQEEQPNAITE